MRCVVPALLTTDVEVAESRERRGDDTRDVGVVAHVAGTEFGVAAACADLARDTFAVRDVDVVDEDLRAFRGEAPGDAFAESRARAGDDRNLVSESHLVLHPCWSTTVFSTVKPCNAAKPFSRPYPECLTPPNGNSTPPPAP